MEELELLLTDEFIGFSAKIAEIHQKKKVAQEEFKKVFDAYKAGIAQLDADAKEAQQAWEDWKLKAAEGHKAERAKRKEG
jgi:hypothetical protein